MRECSIVGCQRPVKFKELCGSHYHRLMKYGDPNAGSTRKGAPKEFMEAVLEITPYPSECIFWPYSKGGGGAAHIDVEGRNRNVARIICERLHGAPPSHQMDAAHSCGNGHLSCINPAHLRWATRRENVADSIAHGTAVRGERQGSARLKEADVLAIYSLRGLESQEETAARFGVSRQTISDICRGYSWSWLTQDRRAFLSKGDDHEA